MLKSHELTTVALQAITRSTTIAHPLIYASPDGWGNTKAGEWVQTEQLILKANKMQRISAP